MDHTWNKNGEHMYQKRINKKGSFDERFENQIWKNIWCVGCETISFDFVSFNWVESVKKSKMDEENEFKALPMSEITEYEKVRLLGAGGFGKVYLVQHSTLETKCAAKEQIPSKEAREEAKVLKKLGNEQVIFL